MTICSRISPVTPSLRRRTLLAALLVPAFGRVTVAAQADDAARFIETLGKEVVATLANKSLDQAAKLDRLSKLLDEAIDLEIVGRLVLGRYWREATPAQRAEYLKLFRALAVKAMADRLRDYNGETFEILSSRAVDDRDSTVAVRIVRPVGTPVGVDWRVRALDNRMSVVDIVAEGVSLVVTQRSEATDIASKRGLDGLIAEMRARLDRPTTG